MDTDREDRKKELQEHLQLNRAHYGHSILANLDPATLMSVLSGYTLSGRSLTDIVEPDIIAIAGNYVVLRAPIEAEEGSGVIQDEVEITWAELLNQRGLDAEIQEARTIPIPTDGVFAEAVLGRSNAAEKLDITRFWNWQDSPIPLQPPEITPVGTGTRGTPETLTPGDLSAPLLNIVNPTSLPDPAGIGAALSTLAISNMFRDMSGLAGTQDIAESAASEAAQAANQAGQLASTNLKTEAQKAVAMGQIAADIAKAAMGIPDPKSTDGISAEGARINQGKDMDKRGVSNPGNTSMSSGGGSGSSSGSGGSSGGSGDSSGPKMSSSSREAAYADHGALGYSPGGLGALSKLVGGGAFEPAVFSEEDVQKAANIAPHWRNLLKFEVPADVVTDISRRDMRVQKLQDGEGDLSMDSYPALIKEFPVMNGATMDAGTFIEHVRKNLNSFVDTFWADFLPYTEENPEDPNPDGTSDGLRWLAGNAVKTVFDIDIPGDNGAVVCSEHDESGWIFSIVEAPDPGLHPLCGHRRFQLSEVKAGTGVYFIHTTGVDRKTKLGYDPFWVASSSQVELWTSFQNKVVEFVNSNGGQAEVMDYQIRTMSWDVVAAEMNL